VLKKQEPVRWLVLVFLSASAHKPMQIRMGSGLRFAPVGAKQTSPGRFAPRLVVFCCIFFTYFMQQPEYSSW